MIRAVLSSALQVTADALVNAANERMRGGGGLDGAVHQAAGPAMLRELQRIAPRGCPTGGVVVTPGFDLPHQWVIHAVGPIWRGGGEGEAEALASCHRNAISEADARNCESLSMCCLSVGSFGYPLQEAAAIAALATREALADAKALRTVIFACFNQRELAAYQAALKLDLD